MPVHGEGEKALLLYNYHYSQFEFHHIGREVNSSRYEGTDAKKLIIKAL